MIEEMDEDCASYIRSVTQITRLLQGKWTLQILCAMRISPVRLSQLTRLIPAASKKALRSNLRALEGAEIVVRRDMSSKVLHVEYDFSDNMRETLRALLEHLAKCGRILEGETEIAESTSLER